LLACRTPLQRRLTRSGDVNERAAYRILMRAIEEPMRVIAANAGCDPDAVLARVLDAPPGYGFDAEAGEVVAMAATGLLDAAATLKAAVHVGIGGAAIALTTGVLVHHEKLQQEFSP